MHRHLCFRKLKSGCFVAGKLLRSFDAIAVGKRGHDVLSVFHSVLVQMILGGNARVAGC